jgi:predicted DNA-binding transcriptional regulator YafY
VRRLERLVAMALFLSARRRLRAESIARHFAISLRTVYRDVRALQEAGFPVEGTAGDGYRVAQESFLRPLSLTPAEAEALALAARTSATVVDEPSQAELARAMAKLEAGLEASARRRLRAVHGEVRVPAFARREVGPMAAVLASLRDRTVAAVTYRDASGAATARHLEPLGVIFLGEGWLLIAYCRLRRAPRAFRLERVAAWTATDVRFEPRPGLSFAEIVDRERAAYEARRARA